MCHSLTVNSDNLLARGIIAKTIIAISVDLYRVYIYSQFPILDFFLNVLDLLEISRFLGFVGNLQIFLEGCAVEKVQGGEFKCLLTHR